MDFLRHVGGCAPSCPLEPTTALQNRILPSPRRAEHNLGLFRPVLLCHSGRGLLARAVPAFGRAASARRHS
ncbi:MAG: hypothetical protein JSR58_05100 [Verrucomicrobia bacterium]|nr:hypothetical protein [Verrucomicrobiota bacterium]